MTPTPIARFALVLALLAGLGWAAVGLWRPGQLEPAGLAGGAAKPLLASAKKKLEAVRQGQEEVARDGAAFSGLQGTEGEHRVFVSPQLVYLPESAEPVVPLDRRTKTEDGIEVGWKIKHGFDPASPRIQEEDPDADGFTNREEFLAGTHPLRNEDSPAKESKLKSRSGPSVPLMVSFDEKSGGVFTIRFELETPPKPKDFKPGSAQPAPQKPVGFSDRKEEAPQPELPRKGEIKGKIGDMFWVMAGPDFVEVYSSESKLTAALARAKATGKNQHAIPIRIHSYQEKVEEMPEAKAGGLSLPRDNSFVVLERKDAAGGMLPLAISTTGKPNPGPWDVGEILFYAPISGGRELGPYRVGEVFSYEGIDLAILGREDKKIRLRNLSEPTKEPFLVPPDVESPVPPPKP